ncbi:hypothetical protein T484DRAFT_1757898 [Baffinella frigidus]|nr:hypothetical protein T484DRAFT_1757898 [Cryptophyta sp. CCMP2293]
METTSLQLGWPDLKDENHIGAMWGVPIESTDTNPVYVGTPDRPWENDFGAMWDIPIESTDTTSVYAGTPDLKDENDFGFGAMWDVPIESMETTSVYVGTPDLPWENDFGATWDVPIENNEMDVMEYPEPVEKNETDVMEDPEPAQDETTASTPKRKPEKRPYFLCYCTVPGKCNGMRFECKEYLQKHNKIQHGDPEAVKELNKHTNEVRNKTLKKRRDEDPVFAARERVHNAKNYQKKK